MRPRRWLPRRSRRLEHNQSHSLFILLGGLGGPRREVPSKSKSWARPFACAWRRGALHFDTAPLSRSLQAFGGGETFLSVRRVSEIAIGTAHVIQRGRSEERHVGKECR